jgi:hypothetical protein
MIIETKVSDQVIYFDTDKHRFWKIVDGKKVPVSSVTTFTGVIDKSAALIGWAVKLTRLHLTGLIEQGEIIGMDHVLEACKQHTIRKQEAADIGTQIHALVEQWIKGEEFEIPEDDRVRNGFDAFLKFQKAHNAKWIDSEKIIYSRKYDYAGILDAVGEIDGKLVLVDFKSSNGLYPEYSFQAAAYQIAYEEMTGKKIDHRLIIRFGKEDGEFEVKKYAENDADKAGFIACLTLKNRLKQLEKSIN